MNVIALDEIVRQQERIDELELSLAGFCTQLGVGPHEDVLAMVRLQEITAKLDALERSIADLSHPNIRMVLEQRDALRDALKVADDTLDAIEGGTMEILIRDWAAAARKRIADMTGHAKP